MQERIRPCLCISCPECGSVFMAVAMNKDYHNDSDSNKELLDDLSEMAAKGYDVSFKPAKDFKMDKCNCN